MNKILFIVLAALGVFSLSLKGDKDTSKLFVGYTNNSPVFDSYQEKKLFFYKNGSIEILRQYKATYRIISVNNSHIVYEENLKDGTYNLIIADGNEEKKFPLKTELTFAGNDDAKTAYTDQKDGDKIKLIAATGKIIDLNIKGYVNKLIKNSLYYTVDAPLKNFDGANTNLYRLDISKPNARPLKVMSNTVGESLVILPGEKFVYDEVFYKGKSVPVIYCIAEGKFKILSVEEKFLNATPFYSHERNCLVFYEPKTLEMKFVDIPKEFDLKR